MDISLKILILGDSPRENLSEAEALKNHNIVCLSVSSDISHIKEESPHLIIIDSSETESIERVLGFMGEEVFEFEPVFLVLIKEGCVDKCEKLLAACHGADRIYEPLSSGAFACKIEFLSGIVKARMENCMLREMVTKSRVAGHEINNPLTSIIGNTEMLLEEDLDGITKKMVDIVRREGLRIARLVEDMMESSRLDNM